MSQPARPSRRHLLTAGGAGLAAGALATAASLSPDRDPAPSAATPDPTSRFIDPYGPQQAGVHRPVTPPTHLNFHVLSATSEVLTRADVRRTLADLGRSIAALTARAPRDERLTAAPAGLTVQVGIGPRLVALSHASVPLQLPEFAGSAELPERRRQGDLVLSVAADLPEVSAQVTDVLLTQLAAAGHESNWSQIGFRPQGAGAVTHNPLGFHDGIVQPGVAEGLPEHVFLGRGPARGGSVGVVRRFVMDTTAFRALSTPDQEAVIGRDKSSGAPLSGGSMTTDVNLTAKSPTGEYVIPARSHVRAAHPTFTGSTVMLRRGYGFRESVDGQFDRSGLLFVSYADDVQVFSRTQLRMDREDALMDFAVATAEVAFLVLPGFDASRPLGSALFA